MLFFETFICWTIKHNIANSKMPEVYPYPKLAIFIIVLKIAQNIPLFLLFFKSFFVQNSHFSNILKTGSKRKRCVVFKDTINPLHLFVEKR